ncbi:DNA polymerase delta subunit 4 [Fulvia fulva]|nr:DNA polymerase delta subunit 4 [Fulvia fulva]KAK4618910.1 DNA polymerase delta subunit 4 [Fulvia fulva]WPV18589.1 DNA polymerase delta subunit 4 [Fulvia fulva]WPV33443.1 DNA polymerase delta subunit 4 [Fulvia fulva]
MPPKSREATRQSSQQSTLSFHGKDRSKVTKPASPRNAKASKKDPALFEDISHTDVKTETDPDVDEPTTAEEVIKEQADESVKDPISTNAAIKTEDVLGGRAAESEVGATGGALGAGWEGNEEAEARKITETQIERYWRAKDQERKAPRVHQEDLTVHEKILREWDMSGQYGPCIGIARLKRWKRANMLGLKPPMEVLSVLLKNMDDGNAKSQRAHVDELMSSRFVET